MPGQVQRATTRAGHRRTRTGVTTRLVALGLLPVSAMGLVVGRLTIEYRARAAEAAEVERTVPRVDRLLALREAVHVELTAVGITARAVQFGLQPGEMATTLGLPQSRVSRRYTRAATDNAIRVLGSTSPIDARALGALRRRIDAGALNPADATYAFVEFDRKVDGVGTPLFRTLQRKTQAMVDGTQLSDDLSTLQASIDALGHAGAQAIDLGILSLATQGGTFEERARLVRDTTLYQQAAATLTTSRLSVVRGAWLRISTNHDIVEVNRAVALFEAGKTPAGGTAAVLVTSKGVLARDAELSHLVKTVGSVAEGRARVLHDSATHAYRMWLWRSALIALVTMAIAFFLARSVIRPLRQLAASARRVGAGELDDNLVNARGPRDTVQVADAFNDLVLNLRLLEAKSRALARCDFNDPVLDSNVPGNLGKALQRSLRVLSGSIGDRKQLQSRLQFHASHDSLTGLVNRAAVLDALGQAIARERSSGSMTAVIFAHVNELKRANDTYGHDLGDELLRVVADGIRQSVRPGDVLSRLGPDDFLIVAENVHDIDEADALAKRVVAAVAEIEAVDSCRISVSAAAGVAFSRDGMYEPTALLQRADLAAYSAKGQGPAVVFYDEELQLQLTHRAEIEDALSATLADGGHELRLHYQPILQAPDGNLVSVEALIRWERPDVGLVAPDDFIPIAEASDLIVELDRWVLRTATEQLAQWSTQPALANVALAVNVSGRHLLHPDFAAHVDEVLDLTGIEPDRLIIEITESALVTDLTTAAEHLDRVRHLGVRVAIDDFGTGFTSLAHLRRMPMDEIKIDRSFVSHPDDASDQRMIRIIIDLADNLGVPTVAEGVETEEQLRALVDLGCDVLQGYFFSRPLPPDAFVAWASTRLTAAEFVPLGLTRMRQTADEIAACGRWPARPTL
jgi:diguanylate cyclase (GGDEF)-like protein